MSCGVCGECTETAEEVGGSARDTTSSESRRERTADMSAELKGRVKAKVRMAMFTSRVARARVGTPSSRRVVKKGFMAGGIGR